MISRLRGVGLGSLAAGWGIFFLATAGLAQTNGVGGGAAANLAELPPDPLRLIIARDEQRIDIYRGTTLLKSSRISTGKRGHETPLGVYSILGKSRHHRSNIYSNAPMPYMQRITWSGMALHQGHVPNYPASHGCIRLPKAFAAELFKMTQVGLDVIVTAGDTTPKPIEHNVLFRPSPPGAAIGSHDEGDAGPASDPATAAIGLADMEYMVDRIEAYRNRSTKPIRILITRRTGQQRMKDIQRMLFELGHDPGDIDGYLGRNTGGAIQAFQRSIGEPATGMVTDELVSALYKAVGREEATGHLYVRQNRKALFDAPVAIAGAEDEPLGTHMFSLGHFDEGDTGAWTALTVGDDVMPTPRATLDRLSIPAPMRERIAALLVPGSSLIVSDTGLGRETGKGTDFIVQPR